MPQPWPTVSADHASVTSRARAAHRRRPEAADLRRAERSQIGEVLEADAIEDALIGGKVGQHEAGGEVGGLERRGPGAAQHVLELVGRRVFDQHPRRPIGAAPDDGASRR